MRALDSVRAGGVRYGRTSRVHTGGHHHPAYCRVLARRQAGCNIGGQALALANPTSQSLIEKLTELAVEHGKTGGLLTVIGGLVARMLSTARRGARVETSVRQLERRVAELSETLETKVGKVEAQVTELSDKMEKQVDELKERVQESASERQALVATLRTGQERMLAELVLARQQITENAERTETRLNSIDERHNRVVVSLLSRGGHGT